MEKVGQQGLGESIYCGGRYVYMCVYVCVCVRACMRARVRVRVRVCVYVCVYICVYVHSLCVGTYMFHFVCILCYAQFSVCVLCWVHLSPTHSSAVGADWLPSCAPAACVSVAVEHSVTCTCTKVE